MTSSLVKLAVGALLLFAIACESRYRLTVNLPAGYKGKVTVLCSSPSHEDTTVQVDAKGEVIGACPAHDPKLSVYRGGEKATPSDVKWTATGDGIVTGLDFSAQ